MQEQAPAGTVSANLQIGLGVDERFARTKAGVTSTYLTDRLGSTVALADSAGVVQTSYGYDPYGVTSQTGAANDNPYQFTGRQNDGTGLYYYRARYYNPSWGRFVSEDPIGLAGGINQYAYVGGTPTIYRDPSGRIFLPLVTGAIGGIGGFGGNLAWQLYNNPGCINWKSAFVAGGVGAVAGFAAPFVATSYLGAAALGGLSNVANYYANAAITGSSTSPQGVLIAAGTGVAGGLVGGPISNPYWFVSSSSVWRMGQGAAIANSGVGSVVRSVGAGVAGSFEPGGSSGQ